MSSTFKRLSNDTVQRSPHANFLKSHIISAYEEIDRLQDLNNNRSTEVLQLSTEVQNQQMAHHTDY